MAINKEAGKSFKPEVKTSKELPPAVAADLQKWLDEQWENNKRYGQGTVDVLAEIAVRFYELGQSEKQ